MNPDSILPNASCILGWMSLRSIAIPGIIAALVVFTLGACSSFEASTSAPPPDSRQPDIHVLPPTPTAASSPTPTPSPLEQGFLIIEDVDNAASIRQMSVKGQVFMLEIADTPAERALGLMHRESLAENAGMLFVFSQEAPLNFWMKNTLIPLDILYIDSAGVVVDIQTMHPQPGVPDSELQTYPSAAPAQYALEINADLAESLGFAVGDQAYFR